MIARPKSDATRVEATVTVTEGGYFEMYLPPGEYVLNPSLSAEEQVSLSDQY